MALLQAVVRGLRFLAWFVLAGIVAARPSFAVSDDVERDDRSLPIERLQFNLLANAALVSRATTADVAIPQWLTVSGASSTTPIEIRTPVPHRLATGDEVLIRGVLGSVAANGWWTLTVTGENTFTLDSSTAGVGYAGGGAVFPAAGQPQPSGARGVAGDLPWTPWFSAPAFARETEFFQPLGEVYTFPEIPPVNSFLSQEIDGRFFRPGEDLCLSIEARMPNPATGDQRFKMVVTAALGRVRVYSVTYPAAVLTPVYQRLPLCFRLGNEPIAPGGVVRVEFIDEHLRGVPKPMYWTRPMLNEGRAPAPWTPNVDPMTRTRAFY